MATAKKTAKKTARPSAAAKAIRRNPKVQASVMAAHLKVNEPKPAKPAAAAAAPAPAKVATPAATAAPAKPATQAAEAPKAVPAAPAQATAKPAPRTILDHVADTAAKEEPMSNNARQYNAAEQAEMEEIQAEITRLRSELAAAQHARYQQQLRQRLTPLSPFRPGSLEPVRDERVVRVGLQDGRPSSVTVIEPYDGHAFSGVSTSKARADSEWGWGDTAMVVGGVAVVGVAGYLAYNAFFGD